MIAGTAAVPVGMTVTVDLADETLAAVVDSTGAWSATAAHLADGAHRIVMAPPTRPATPPARPSG